MLKFIKQGTSILFVFFLSFLVSGVLHAAERPKKPALPNDSLSVKDGLENTIIFTARDSVVYNFDRRTMELLGKASLGRKDTSVKAPKIVVNIEDSQLYAYGDSTKALSDPAIFIDSHSSFNAPMITYNFKTGNGVTAYAHSSFKGVTFRGKQVKKLEDGRMKITGGTFTSCDVQDAQDSEDSPDSEDLSNPHYWFSSPHITIVPDKMITATPLVIYVKPEIFFVRLPAVPIMVLPYMVFPIKSERSSGFLTPGYGNDNLRGYYLSNLGYYWAISDYADLRLQGNISPKGSWQLADRFRYKKENSFSGELWAEYKHYSQSNEWNAHVTHNLNQDIDSSVRFDVNLNFSGGERIISAINSGSMLSQLTETKASLAKTFNDENSIAVASFKGSNDLLSQSKRGNVALTYYLNRLYPFRSAISVVDNDWKSNLSITPASSFDGEFSSQAGTGHFSYAGDFGVEAGYYQEFADGYKAFFTEGFNMQIRRPNKGYGNGEYDGVRVVLPLRMQSTIFSHININQGLTYTRSLQTDGEEIPFAAVVFSVDASTRLYSTVSTGLLENVLGLKALRHTFIPIVSYTSNQPFSDFLSSRSYGNRYDWIDPRFNGQYGNSFNAGVPQGARTVTLTLNNLFDGKFRGSSSTDSAYSTAVDHTDQLLSLSAKASYNFAADSFQLQPLVVTASSSALSPNFLLSSGSMYEFYTYNDFGGLRNRFLYEDDKGLLRFVKGFVNVSYSFQGSRDAGSSASTFGAPVWSDTEQNLFSDRFKMSGFNTIDYSLPWQFQFSLYMESLKLDPTRHSTYTSLVNGTARVNLLKNWQFGLTSGYDFQNNKAVFPLLQAYRNLHCWQVGVQWVPFGEFKSYSIQIGLLAPQLKEVKYRTTSRPQGY